MGMTFKKATKVQAKLRLAIAAPPGGGKTWTALTVAKHLGGSVALIDTEHGSASKYANVFDFDTMELDNFSLDNYIAAIKAAEAAGYDILIIDSLSHAWVGAGGALEEVDRLKQASRSGNAFTDGWGKVTPKHNRLIDTILAVRMHVIATMRQKMSYELETVNGRSNTPVKKGLAPIQREGMEYEFDIIGEMDPVDNTMRISKTRCPELAGKVFEKPGQELAAILKVWLSDGAPAETRPAIPATLEEVVANANAHISRETGDAIPFYGATADAMPVLKAAGFTGWKPNDGDRIGKMENALVEHGIRQSKADTPQGQAA